MPRIKRTPVDYWPDPAPSPPTPASLAVDLSSGPDQTNIGLLRNITSPFAGFRSGELAVTAMSRQTRFAANYSVQGDAAARMADRLNRSLSETRIAIPRDIDFAALEQLVDTRLRERIAIDMESYSNDMWSAMLFGVNSMGLPNDEGSLIAGQARVAAMRAVHAYAREPVEIIWSVPEHRARYVKDYNYFTERAMHGRDKPRASKLLKGLAARLLE